MAYNTKNIVRDAAGAPVPQYFNPTADEYQVLQGRNGANRVELYGPDGNPIGTTSSKLNVRASEIEAILTAIQGYVDGLEAAVGEVQAAPTAYTVLARLKDLADRLGEVSSNPTANTVLARLKALEGYVDGVESALATLNSKDFATQTTLNQVYQAVDGVESALGTQADAEATGNGSIIAILKRLRTLIGQALAALGSAAPSYGLLVAGSDGTNARALKVASTGEALVQLTGSYATIKSAPATGAKTVTTTAAEIFAGASRLPNRYYMAIYNTDSSNTVYIGGSSVTTSNGFPVRPGDCVELQFSPSVETAVYAVSSVSTSVRVVELA